MGKDTHLRAVAIAPLNNTDWGDAFLTKDCGLIPFLLHKNHGVDVSMVGTSDDLSMYPSANLLPGLKLVPMPNAGIEEKIDYLMLHGKEIDILLLHGVYETNQAMAIMYKEVNPAGCVFVNTDLNINWLSRINTEDVVFKKFLEAADVMTATNSYIAEEARARWNKDILFVTNGYYNLTGVERRERRFSEKEDIILTVGRLGDEQKRTDILLEAFAMQERFLSGWKLRLVGDVNRDFTRFIDDFFMKYPYLRDRIDFVGKITAKEVLTEEYEKAKVFALPSNFEGGPNVIGEALMAGCSIAVTRIDAWSDCIDAGKCGEVSAIGDVVGFGASLRRLCTNPDLSKMSEHAREYAIRCFDMEKNVDVIFGAIMDHIDCN